MNKSVILRSRPEGAASLENFAIEDRPVPQPADGEILVRQRYFSVDPYLRGRMNDVKSYTTPFKIGEPLGSDGIGEVMESRHGDFKPGDWVMAAMPWQEVCSVTVGQSLPIYFRRIDPDDLPPTYHLGLLGMPGQTAWTGLKGLGQPKEGETVFVSAASGAVGSTVGQIAKQLGCRIAGCAGSDAKVAYLLDELGFDAAFNYKTEPDLSAAVRRCCPDGVDVNYENVGGPVMDAVYDNMNFFSRMIVCGLISRYQAAGPQAGPPMMPVLVKRIRIQGFICSDYPELCGEWLEVGSQWVRDGKLTYRESIKEGIDGAPEAMLDVLAGRNFGKQIVRV